ncbi:hypothetical protein pb186bvf_010605 [Paramecium bursaria]
MLQKEQLQKILQQLFPNIDEVSISKINQHQFTKNQTIYQQGSQSNFVYYILQGEVRLEENIEQTQQKPLMMRLSILNKSRVLLIKGIGSILGVIILFLKIINQVEEVLMQKPYSCTAKANFSTSLLLQIPSQIYIEQKQKTTGKDTYVELIKSDALLLTQIKQIRLIKQNYDRSRLKTDQSTTLTLEEKLQRLKLFRKDRLTIDAPLYETRSRRRLPAPAPQQDHISTRPRSISCPQKKSQQKEDNTLKKSVSIINYGDYLLDFAPKKPAKIQISRLFLN